jgi:hypothetical protein
VHQLQLGRKGETGKYSHRKEKGGEGGMIEWQWGVVGREGREVSLQKSYSNMNSCPVTLMNPLLCNAPIETTIFSFKILLLWT